MRRPLLTALATAGLLIVTAVPAFAHAGFVQSSVPADSDQTLSLRVPGERAGQATLTVETLVPAAFTDVACASHPTHTCATSAHKNGGTVVTWSRASGAADAVPVYSFSVHTPKKTGAYQFPTIQTYNGVDADGHAEENWTGDLSPELTVTPAGTPVTNNSEEPDTDHGDGEDDQPTNESTPPPSNGGKTPAKDSGTTSSGGSSGGSSDTSSGSSGGSSSTGGSSGSTGSSTASGGSSDASDTGGDVSPTAVEAGDDATLAGDTTTATDDANTTGLAGDAGDADVLGADEASDEGGSGLLWLGLVLVLAAGGGLFVQRRMAATDGPTDGPTDD